MSESQAGRDATPLRSRAGEATVAARHVIPRQESEPDTARQIVDDETMLDGNFRLNLATFVSTWMDDDAKRGSGRGSQSGEHPRCRGPTAT